MSHPAPPRCLVVEDDPPMRMLIDLMLGEAGGQVVTVGTIAEAKTALADGPFAMVVVDRNLSATERGIEVLKEAAQLTPPPVLMMVSAYVPPDAVTEANGIGAQIVDKVDLTKLVSRWAQLVSASGS